jgi:hypothetical protein
MQIGAVTSSTTPSATTQPPVASSTQAFSDALRSKAQTAAARDVLVTLPPQLVQTLRSQSGSPVEAVDRLFEVLKDGSFTPPAGPLGGPNTIIGATARAASLFDTPTELWDAMRATLSQPEAVRAAVDASTEAIVSEASGGAPNIESLDQATAILGGRLSVSQVAWWESALWYLIDGGSQPAA